MSQTQEEIQKENDVYIAEIFPASKGAKLNPIGILGDTISNGWTIKVEQFLKDDRFKPNFEHIKKALIYGEYEIVELLFKYKHIDFSAGDNGLILYAMNNDMDDMTELFWSDKRVQKHAMENRTPKSRRILENFRSSRINKLLKEFDTSNE